MAALTEIKLRLQPRLLKEAPIRIRGKARRSSETANALFYFALANAATRMRSRTRI